MNVIARTAEIEFICATNHQEGNTGAIRYTTQWLYSLRFDHTEGLLTPGYYRSKPHSTCSRCGPDLGQHHFAVYRSIRVVLRSGAVNGEVLTSYWARFCFVRKSYPAYSFWNYRELTIHLNSSSVLGLISRNNHNTTALLKKTLFIWNNQCCKQYEVFIYRNSLTLTPNVTPKLMWDAIKADL